MTVAVRRLLPCQTVDPETFFPGPGKNEEAEAAAKLCRSCPILLDCLAGAVRRGEQGVWGGTTRKQRDRLRQLR